MLDPTDPGAGSIDEKVANAHNATNLLATVAMDYSAHPSDPNNRRFTKFYVFDANGDRINKIDLDGRGAKYVPGACNVCHGGNPTPLDQDGLYPDFGNTGAGFLPWDLDVLGFSTTVANGQYTRKNQEAELRQMNQAILNTNPTATTRDLVEGWYGGAGLPNATYNGQYVPLGWQSEPKYYLDVYGPNCRACHIMRNEAVDFSSSAEFHAFDLRIRNMVFNYGVMPLAKRTYQRFWTLPVSTLDIASNNTLGLQGDNFVFDLAISNNGRYVVYGYQSENQFSGDSNGRTDIHLKDVLTNELFWVSTSSVGLASDQNSRAPVVSDDGRYVVFESHGSTLVAPDTNNAAEIFIKDTQTGALSVVSSSSAGVRGINSQQYSARPAVTPEGRYVAFTSNFGGLVANDTKDALI